MVLKISFNTLQEILKFEASKTVGKVMKRFEILDNKDLLKKDLKELLYESYRDLGDLLYSAGRGLEPTIFDFKVKKEKE